MRPNVVSKQRLIREVWGDSVRHRRGDEPCHLGAAQGVRRRGDASPRYIQTIAKKGYRLLAEVSYSAAPEPLAAG